MSTQGGSWCGLFSTTLEDCILYSSKDTGKFPETLSKQLLPDEIEAWNMWVYRSHGIMPNQFHYFYDDGDTIIFREHIQDLLTIDNMYANKLKRDRDKSEAEQQRKQQQMKNNKVGGSASGFYGQTYRYK